MKCVYCGSRVERLDWFCPHCKRSIPRRTEPRTLSRESLLMGAGVAAALGLALAAGQLVRVGAVPLPFPGRRTSASAAAGVTVLTVPAVRTFVYLNGGALLGEAPLTNAPIPPGRQTLVLWSPSIGGRATRQVNVEPGGSALVVENMRARDRFE